jgi:DnaJ-class molecular chaperone
LIQSVLHQRHFPYFQKVNERLSLALCQEIGFAFEVLSDDAMRTAYDAGGLPGVEAQGHADTRGPSDPSSHHKHAPSEESPHAASQRRRRDQAFATYRAVFGHNPVADPPRDGTGAASRGGLGVHNMAAQRGGSSFDVLQRKNLDDLFCDLGLDQQTKASSRSAAGKGGGAASSAGRGERNGVRADTPDGWYH